jgi:hypothetical protein
MPLPGGPSDKAGNRYERRWTVHAMLDVLAGQAESIRIEVPGEEGAGAEFRVTVEGVAHWYQAKRQRAMGAWTVAALRPVLEPMWAKLQAGGHFVFASGTSADELRELADRARSAASWAEYEQAFLAATEQRDRFDRLRGIWGTQLPEQVFAALRRVQVRTVGEQDLAALIEARSPVIVDGDPSSVFAVLSQLADDAVHQELRAPAIWRHLEAHGLRPSTLGEDPALRRRLLDDADRYVRRLQELHIDGKELPRAEAGRILAELTTGHRVLATGGAGSGKSTILGRLVQDVRALGWPVLVVRADDRRLDAATIRDLGVALVGRPESPVTVLAAVAGGADALLVVDQLDVVSLVSGRHPERFDVVADLIEQAANHPSLHVVGACRQFDLENDRRLRMLATDPATKAVAVGMLDEATVRQVLEQIGVDPAAVPAAVVRLLALPLHLWIYVHLVHANDPKADDVRSLHDLYDHYWDATQAACAAARDGTDEWVDVIDLLVEHMSARQELAAPADLLDRHARQVRVMASEGVLLRDQGRVRLFHETFFDYCYARYFVRTGRTLAGLLVDDEQDLFRRAQVRQVLVHQRSSARADYEADLAWLLTSPKVRWHIKALVIALVGSIPAPTAQEWRLLRDVAVDPDHPLNGRAWQALRSNPAWMPLADGAGDWEAWLEHGDEPTVNQALWALSGAVLDHYDRVVSLVQPYLGDPGWHNRIVWFLRLAPLHAGRPVIELMLAAIATGLYDDPGLAEQAWDALHDLAAHRPEWAAEIIEALVSRGIDVARQASVSDPFKGDQGPLALHRRVSLADEALLAAARGAPIEFAERLLPHALDLMAANPQPGRHPTLTADALWTARFHTSPRGDLAHTLLETLEQALQGAVAAVPERAQPLLDRLRTTQWKSASFLLARAYLGDPAAHADQAAIWLATAPGALDLGYVDAPHWASRELIAAITPHCSDTALAALTARLLYYTPTHEQRPQARRYRGAAELGLLNGIEANRRSPGVCRRLAELRRKFQRDDDEPPRGIEVSWVPPPIPEDKAARMNDDQWLGAIRKHATEDMSFAADGRLTGGASTQAQVLETAAGQDPARFGRLLLRFPDSTNEAYVGAVLRGITGAPLEVDLILSVCRRAHQLASGEALRGIVRLVASRADAALPDDALDLVATVARSSLDLDAEAWRPPADDGTRVSSGDIDLAGLNSSRGAAAEAIGVLIAKDPGRLDRFRDTISHLAADPVPPVRAMLAGALGPVLDVDADFAIRSFLAAVHDAPDDLLGSRYVQRFLSLAVRGARYDDIAAVVQRMLASQHADIAKAGGRQLTLASLLQPELDGQVDDLLAGSEPHRAGVVEVFAHWVTFQPRRDRIMAVLAAAFDDNAKEVRAQAVTTFQLLGEVPLTAYTPLFEAFAHSRAVTDFAGDILRVLEKSRHPLPDVALTVCERLLSIHGKDAGDIRTAAAGDAVQATRLLLRIHRQHASPDLRRRCLDLFDRFIAAGVHGIEAALDKVER